MEFEHQKKTLLLANVQAAISKWVLEIHKCSDMDCNGKELFL